MPKSYRIVPQRDLTCKVEISDGKPLPLITISFGTEAEAQTWIVEKKRRADLRAGVQRLGDTAKAELKGPGQ